MSVLTSSALVGRESTMPLGRSVVARFTENGRGCHGYGGHDVRRIRDMMSCGSSEGGEE